MSRRNRGGAAVQAQNPPNRARSSQPWRYDRDLAAAIAVTRFGLGAKPGEIADGAGRPAGLAAGADPPGAGGADQPMTPAPDVRPAPAGVPRLSARASARAETAEPGLRPGEDGRQADPRRRRRRLPRPRPAGRRPPTPASASAGRCSGATTSPSRPTKAADRDAGRAVRAARRSARTCSAASRTCWSPPPAIRPCCSISTRPSRSGPDSMAATFLSRSRQAARA